MSYKDLKIPEKVVVGGCEYKVHLCNNTKEFEKVSGVTDAYGSTQIFKKEICLDLELHKRDGANDDQIRETFYHEMGHALLEETGISASLTSEIEEVIVEAYSKVIKTMRTSIRKTK